LSSANGEFADIIVQRIMEEKTASAGYMRLMALGLGLLFLSCQEEADLVLEALKVVDNHNGKQAEVLVQMCAYAGTGNVLQVQKMLQLCSESTNVDSEDDCHQDLAVLGIALISMGEDVGTEMSLRTFNHLMYYGESVVRESVPLALGLLYASNPVVSVLDTLSKYSHDNDQEVAINAIFAMGLVGAGTNNARLAQMLRLLAVYYHKNANCLFVVRIAQGLVHLAKGTMTLNPYHANRQLMSRAVVSGLLSTIIAFSESEILVLGKFHYLLYNLVSAMSPRFLITVDEQLKPLPVTVRVGQAVNVVGQAGRPKAITGFQTHSTPVLLAYNERAELATEEYIPYAPDMEGIVILRKNPDYVDDREK